MNPVVDLFFELLFVDEAVDLQSAEEMADAFALPTLRSGISLVELVDEPNDDVARTPDGSA